MKKLYEAVPVQELTGSGFRFIGVVPQTTGDPDLLMPFWFEDGKVWVDAYRGNEVKNKVTHFLREVGSSVSTGEKTVSDEEIEDYIENELGWSVDGTAESNDMIRLAKWMRSRLAVEQSSTEDIIEMIEDERTLQSSKSIWHGHAGAKYATEILDKLISRITGKM